MRRTVVGGIIVVTTVILGVAAGLAFAAVPNKSDDASTMTAGIAGVHEVIGKGEYSSAPRKQGFAKCPAGETVISGGYLLVGDFQTRNAPAPRALPVVTESNPGYTNGIRMNIWSVVAIAPNDFSGKWGVTPKAVCAKGR